MKDFTENMALEELRRRGVGLDGRWLSVDSGSLGIRKLALVDYLVNHKKYQARFRRETRRGGKI